MDTRVETTLEKRKKGYNCAQSVACTYCDMVGVDEKLMFQMTETLGAGMAGTMEGHCGAVAAACVLASMKQSTGESGCAGQRESYIQALQSDPGEVHREEPVCDLQRTERSTDRESTAFLSGVHPGCGRAGGRSLI